MKLSMERRLEKLESSLPTRIGNVDIEFLIIEPRDRSVIQRVWLSELSREEAFR